MRIKGYEDMIMNGTVDGNDIGNLNGDDADLADLPEHLQINGMLSNIINGNSTQNDNGNTTNRSSSGGGGIFDWGVDPSIYDDK